MKTGLRSPDFQSPAVVGWTLSIRVCHSNRGSPTDEVVGWTPSDRVCHSNRRSPTDDGMWICQFRGSSCSAQGPCAVSLGPETGRSTYTEPEENVLLQTHSNTVAKRTWEPVCTTIRNSKTGPVLLFQRLIQTGSHRPMDRTAAVVDWIPFIRVPSLFPRMANWFASGFP